MKHVMIDLEMNSIEKENQEIRNFIKREIIEIGAVMMDDQYKIIKQLNCYIKPEYNQIVEKITELTGISNEMVASSKSFKEAMEEFIEWIGDGEVIIYSWSEHDLNQMRKECEFKQVVGDRVDYILNHWVDFQEEFGKLLGIEKKISLNYAVGAAELSFEGQEHNALCDALNTAYIFQLSKDQEKFQRVMQPILDLFRPKETAFTIGEFLPKDLLMSLPEQ